MQRARSRRTSRSSRCGGTPISDRNTRAKWNALIPTDDASEASVCGSSECVRILSRASSTRAAWQRRLELVVQAMRRLRTGGRFDQLRRPGIEGRDAAALQDAIELQTEECKPVAGMEHGYVRSSREPALALDLALESIAEANRHAGIRGYVFEVDVSLYGAGLPGERSSAPEAPEPRSYAQTNLTA